MPTHVLKCLKCGTEEQRYWPTFEKAERGMRRWKCPECGCPKYEKVPQVSFWKWGEKLGAR